MKLYKQLHSSLLSPAQVCCRRMAMVLVSLLSIGGLYSCTGKSGNAGESQASIVQQKITDSISVNNDTMQSQINAYRFQVDNLNTQRAGLDSMLKNKDIELQKMKAELGRYRKSSKKIAARLKKAEAEIKRLKEMSSNDRDQLGLLQGENGNLTQQRDSIARQYFSLKQLASVLHASNIRLEALHLKHHGRKEKNTAKARKTDELRVIFDIDENRIADNGMKDLYLVITGPDGQILPSAGHQTITNNESKTVSYSIVKQISLTKGEPVKDIHTDWHQGGKYAKGTYRIEIYNGGYIIGSGRVLLK